MFREAWCSLNGPFILSLGHCQTWDICKELLHRLLSSHFQPKKKEERAKRAGAGRISNFIHATLQRINQGRIQGGGKG